MKKHREELDVSPIAVILVMAAIGVVVILSIQYLAAVTSVLSGGRL